MDIETAKTANNLAMEIENLSHCIKALSDESSLIILQINVNGKFWNPFNAFNSQMLQKRLNKVILQNLIDLHDQATEILKQM